MDPSSTQRRNAHTRASVERTVHEPSLDPEDPGQEGPAHSAAVSHGNQATPPAGSRPPSPNQQTGAQPRAARRRPKPPHRSPSQTTQAAIFDIAAWTRRTRERQGLPPKIIDPAVLARVVTLALGPSPDGGKPTRPRG